MYAQQCDGLPSLLSTVDCCPAHASCSAAYIQPLRACCLIGHHPFHQPCAPPQRTQPIWPERSTAGNPYRINHVGNGTALITHRLKRILQALLPACCCRCWWPHRSQRCWVCFLQCGSQPHDLPLIRHTGSRHVALQREQKHVHQTAQDRVTRQLVIIIDG
jgi:hypothetical protein